MSFVDKELLSMVVLFRWESSVFQERDRNPDVMEMARGLHRTFMMDCEGLWIGQRLSSVQAPGIAHREGQE
jgi:hypothetical protein